MDAAEDVIDLGNNDELVSKTIIADLHQFKVKFNDAVSQGCLRCIEPQCYPKSNSR